MLKWPEWPVISPRAGQLQRTKRTPGFSTGRGLLYRWAKRARPGPISIGSSRSSPGRALNDCSNRLQSTTPKFP